ncbi:ComF operon protein 1 [Convivina intestini]|nr:helicase-related protein [Convivina intestini]CAH1857314.1 ComF operon protein 1 [Convivina intestini]
MALVSPRVDVIAELAPRLAAAFTNLSQIVLHGKQTTPYGYTQLVLATTHQLLRFKSAFDVLIIDEVDSFPFRGNPMFQYALQTARKKNSMIVYLTATPTPALKTAVKRGNLRVSYLPLRFHQQLLPKLQIKRVNNWRLKMPKLLKKQIEIFIEEQRQFLIFVPYVSDLNIVERYLQTYTQLKGSTVHANDPDRIEKVQQMRQENVQFLITTTILERGVTLPGIDVLILGADENTFSENALVQIAGRVGRSHDRPTGLVLAFVRQINLAVFRAQKQINAMNQRGCQLKKKLEINDELSPVSAKD